MNIKVLEKSSAYSKTGAALGLFPGGLVALKSISENVYYKVIASGIKQTRLVSKDLDGKILRETETATTATSSVYLVWYLLQQYLNEELPQGIVELNKVFLNYTVQHDVGNTVQVSIKDRIDLSVTTYKCKILVGADGIHSAVRTQLFGEIKPRYHGKMMFRACISVTGLNSSNNTDTNSTDNSTNSNTTNDNSNSKHVYPPMGTSEAYIGQENGKLFAIRETAVGIVTFTAMAKFENPYLCKDNNEKIIRLKELFKDYPKEVQYVLDVVKPSAIYENILEDIEVLPVWSNSSVISSTKYDTAAATTTNTTATANNDNNHPSGITATASMPSSHNTAAISNVILLGDAAHAMTSGLGEY